MPEIEDREAAPSIGFAPIARGDATRLILGSLPGVRSLRDAEYYAHPQNAFWRIMAELTGASGTYAQRCEALLKSRIAVWDVLASSVRPGSLDANIDLKTAEVNDFREFLAQHDQIRCICFNGQTAARIFAKRVPAGVIHPNTRLQTLPSTSPAHASMSFDDKLARWRDVLMQTKGESA